MASTRTNQSPLVDVSTNQQRVRFAENVEMPPPLPGNTSPEMESSKLIHSQLTLWGRILVFSSIFLVAFAYSLDGCMRTIAFQPIALSHFKKHPLIGTTNVIASVTAAAAQPVVAKGADIFGRVEIITASIFLYCIGTAVQATATSFAAFCSGAVIYNFGYIAIVLLLEIIISDLTSLRERVIYSYIPTLPFLVNSWLSGIVAQTSLEHLGWRWSIGIWGIIYTGCALPFIAIMRRVYSHARNDSEAEAANWRRQIASAFWQLDIIGLLLLVFSLGLMLTPLTFTRQKSFGFADSGILTPLILGILLFPVFAFWEQKAPHPLLPAKLFKNRAVWSSLGMGLTSNVAYHVQSEYFFSVLIVGFGRSITSATQIANLFNIISVIFGAVVGFAVYKIRRLKPFIIAGTFIYAAGFILMIIFSIHTDRNGYHAIAVAVVLLAIGGGLFPYLNMASIQAAVKLEDTAIVTGMFFATYRVGAAIGSCTAAIIWNHGMQAKLYSTLGVIIATYVYEDPFQFIKERFCNSDFSCPFKLADKFLVVEIFKWTLGIACIVGACMCAPQLGFCFFLGNPRLGDGQSLLAREVLESHELHGMSPRERAAPGTPRTAGRSGTSRPPTTPRSAYTDPDAVVLATPTPHSPLGTPF